MPYVIVVAVDVVYAGTKNCVYAWCAHTVTQWTCHQDISLH